MLLLTLGTQRVVCKSTNFQTGLTMTAYLWSPTLVKSALQTFTEIGEGLYYLDFNFNVAGTWPIKLYEDGVSVTFTVIRVMDIQSSILSDATPFPGAYIDVPISSISGLVGSYDVDLQLYETATTTPIPDVGISVRNADQSLLLGVLTTDSLGQASMSRDAGTYKLLCEKSGFTFTSPETLTVTSGSVAQTIYGTSWVLPSAPTIYTCTVYGWIKDIDNTGLTGKTVSAKLHKKPVYYSGVGYSAIQSASDTTDANGYFELTLTRSKYMTTTTGDPGRYTLTIGEAGLIWIIEVPDAASAAFDDCRI